jgi:hypothetical protein
MAVLIKITEGRASDYTITITEDLEILGKQ